MTIRILFLKLKWLKYLLPYILRKGKSPGKESICCAENIHILGIVQNPMEERMQIRAHLYVCLSHRHYCTKVFHYLFYMSRAKHTNPLADADTNPLK